MTLIEIKQAIKNGDFSLTELNELSAFTNSVKTLSAKSSIQVGDQVYVVQKTKKTLGEVVKVNIKKAIVQLPQGRYNVPLAMIESAS
jgi:hypothetical protein|tara:strand:- start:10092 stop:10352 length:261 start_codon:yes stop_codon:yes gene_type:complete